MVEAKKCKHCREWLTDAPTDAINQPVVHVYATAAPSKEQRTKNGIGLTGFILSIVCLAISWAPGLNIVMWILGLVFSAVGVFKKPNGFAVAGLTISLISLLVIIFFTAVIGELASELWKELGL